jgi:hypothetical protein
MCLFCQHNKNLLAVPLFACRGFLFCLCHFVLKPTFFHGRLVLILTITAVRNCYEKLGKPGAVMQTNEIRADIFTRKEAADFIGVCQNTLDQLDIPRTKVRRRVFYKRSEINKWIDDHTEKTRRRKNERWQNKGNGRQTDG